jgi:hypothetical protein
MVVKYDPNRGIGLVVVLIILALLSLLVAAMLTAVTLEVWIGDNYRAEGQLVYLTQAGIEDGRDAIRSIPVPPAGAPFIENKPLFDTTGREAGRYSVTLVRHNPLTLRSEGAIGTARKTIDVRLKKSGFPWLPQAITLNEDRPLEPNMDTQLETTEGLEKIVDGIARHATDVYRPGPGEAVSLGSVGSPSDYRVVVIDGDGSFGNVSGYGLLVVRGHLEVYGTFSWNGLILVIGQGVLRAAEGATGAISGAVFLTRTRLDDRSPANPLGTLLQQRGLVTFDLPPGSTTIEWSEAEMERANQRFPYVPTTYREF